MEVLPVVGVSIWLFVKILFLIAIGVYIVFAFVVVRQVKLMTQTLDIGFEIPIKIIAWGHLLFALATFVLALLIL